VSDFRSPSPSLADAGPIFLLGVDFEDVRSMLPDGDRYSERLPQNAERLLAFFAERGVKTTFFTVGDVARRYPSTIAEIVQEGHEIGCHTSTHTPLDRLGPEGTRDDLKRCLDDFASAGASEVVGFRAPVGSLTGATEWTYDILRELGFLYSSSVNATRSPLYGWPEYGPDLPSLRRDIWEVPISLTRFPVLSLPFLGGIYLRNFPFWVVRSLFERRLAAEGHTAGYVHPYDIDVDQERFMHPEIFDSRVLNWMMYRNRSRMLDRIDRLMQSAAVIPYRTFVEQHLPPSLA